MACRTCSPTGQGVSTAAGLATKSRSALHAMAIDEMRRPFMPTFWMQRDGDQHPDEQIVEQMWFPGVHSNVGGGYEDTRISDMALAWMISRVHPVYRPGIQQERPSSTRYGPARQARFTGRASGPGWPRAGSSCRSSRRRSKTRGRRTCSGSASTRTLHWSVKERYGYDKTPVDGVGYQKYAPGNLKAEKYSDPNLLEETLVQPEQELARRQVPAQGCQPAVRVQTTGAARFHGAADEAATTST